MLTMMTIVMMRKVMMKMGRRRRIEDGDNAHMMTEQKKIPRLSCKLARCVQTVDWACVTATFTYDKVQE